MNRAIKLGSGVSLVLCVALGVAAVRSNWVVDGFGRQTYDSASSLTASDDIYSSGARLVYERGRRIYNGRHSPAALEQSLRANPRWYRWQSYSFSDPRPGWGGKPVWKISRNVAGWEANLSIPYWLLMTPTTLLPLMWCITSGRRRRRLARGLCPTCGYDLRATPGRCPECGAGAGSRALALPRGETTPAPVRAESRAT